MDMIEKPAAEARTLTWDFSGLLASGHEISGTPTIAQTEGGEDSTSLTVGTPSLATPYVTALVSGGTVGKIYVLEARATATGGQTLCVQGGIAVTEA